MKRRIAVIVPLFLLIVVLAACGGRMSSSATVEEAASYDEFVLPETEMGVAPMALATEAPAMEPMADAAFDTAGQVAAGQPVANQERLIIRNADMSIVATDTEATMTQIAQLANNSGGWVVSSNVYQSTETSKTGYIQIRIPAEGFESVLNAISGMAVRVESLSTSGQDVTEEYVDLSARLGNLEATAARLRTFLDEARNTEEALAVNMELSRIEGEIESIKGRMQYLEQSAAFSSITVNVTPDVLAEPIEVAGWQPTGVAKQAIEALVAALQAIANAVIWFVLFALPVLLLILFPFFLIIWLIRRLRRRERNAPPPPPSTVE